MEKISYTKVENVITPEASVVRDFPPLPNHEPTTIDNWMQMMLAIAHDEPIDTFISKRAAAFREYVTAHPEVHDMFVHNPVYTLEEVGKQLYH